jgi:hypothetical protein
MANQILADPFPGGIANEDQVQIFSGTIALAGSAVTAGEPLNWSNIATGVSYNEINRLGDGLHGKNTALVTAYSASSGTVTATAANNFSAGQQVTFVGNTTTLGLLLNGVTVTVVTATATNFTFLSSATGTGTSEVGLAVSGYAVAPIQGANAPINLTITAISASGSVLTVTAANALLPGAQVQIAVASGTLGPKLAGLNLPVLVSTGTAFTATMPSALSGTTGTGTGIGTNPPQPFSLCFWSELASGYSYAYSRTTGVLFVQVGGASASLPMANLAAGAYPSGVLNDVIRYEAKFLKS